MKIWDASQQGDKGGKARGVCLAFVDVYTCLIIEVGKRFVEVYRSLIEDSEFDNQATAIKIRVVGIGEMRIKRS